MENRKFEDLPFELHFQIFEALDVKDILNLGSSSKTFHKECTDRRVWNNLLKRDFGIGPVEHPRKRYKTYFTYSDVYCKHDLTALNKGGKLYVRGQGNSINYQQWRHVDFGIGRIEQVMCSSQFLGVTKGSSLYITLNKEGFALKCDLEGWKMVPQCIFHVSMSEPITKISCGTSYASFISGKNVYIIHQRILLSPSSDGHIPEKSLEVLKFASTPIDISCGEKHISIITAEGRLYVWNSHGRPSSRSLKSKPLQVSCGNDSTVIVTGDGLYVSGQVLEIEALRSKPLFMTTPRKIYTLQQRPFQVSLGGCHIAVIAEDGLYVWGFNFCNQLGYPGPNGTPYPTRLEISGRPLKVSCGSVHNAVITEEGLYMWGDPFGVTPQLQKLYPFFGHKNG